MNLAPKLLDIPGTPPAVLDTPGSVPIISLIAWLMIVVPSSTTIVLVSANDCGVSITFSSRSLTKWSRKQYTPMAAISPDMASGSSGGEGSDSAISLSSFPLFALTVSTSEYESCSSCSIDDMNNPAFLWNALSNGVTWKADFGSIGRAIVLGFDDRVIRASDSLDKFKIVNNDDIIEIILNIIPSTKC